MAQNTISQRISIDGVIEVINQLRGMGEAGEAAIRRIQSATGAAVSPLANLSRASGDAHRAIHGAHGAVSELEGAIGPALSRLNRFSHGFEELRGVVGTLAPAMKEFVEVGIGAAFVLAAHSAASATRDLVDQATNLGVALHTYEGLRYAFAAVGVGAEGADRILNRLTARMGEALRVSDEFRQTQVISAQERDIQSQKLQETMRKEGEAQGRANRELETAQRELKGVALDQQKVAIALRERTSGTYKITEAEAKLYNPATGVNREKSITSYDNLTKSQQMNLKVGEAQLALESKRAQVQNTVISAQEQYRAASERIRIARQEYTLAEEKARIETEKTKDEFSRLGINLRDANGATKNAQQVLGELADKLNALPSKAERANTMLHIFGRNWAEAARVMKLGSTGINGLIDDFGKFGIAMTEAEAEMGEKFNAAWAKMLIVFESMKNALGNIVGQTFTPVFDAISEFFIKNQAALRKYTAEFTQAFSGILGPAIKAFFLSIQLVLTATLSIFDGFAKRINDIFHTDLTGADLLVGLLAFRLAVTRLLPLLISLWSSLGTGMVALELVALRFKLLWLAVGGARGVIPYLIAALGPGGLLIAGIVAVGAAVITLRGDWGNAFDWIKAKIDNAIWGMKLLALVAGEAAKAIGGLSENPFVATGAAASTPSVSSSDIAKRVEEENPKMFAHHQTGGWIGGHGSGDHVPVLAEPGEFMVKKSIAQQFGGFLNRLNAGLVQGFSMGGIVDSLNSMSPMPATIGGGAVSPARPSDDRAMFHLTIGDKTFKNLSAPADTAQEMVDHARLQDMVSMAPRPSWKR